MNETLPRAIVPKPPGTADAGARSRVKRLFDAEYYLARNPDVAAAGADPLDHFLRTGWREGRDPNRFFALRWYLLTYLDVARSDLNPLVHYVDFGEADGYWPCRIFQPGWYAKTNGIPLGHGR